MHFRRISVVLLSLLISVTAVAQEILFQSDFGSDAGFVVLPGSDDAEFQFNYDYADFDGIPEAPNSAILGGDPQRGLKLEANLSAAAADAIAVATDGLGLTGQYAVQVDVWLNYNFPAGTSGTTEFGGLSVGHDGSSGGLNGASFIYDTDGDSGSDFRLYKDTTFLGIDSGQYDVPTLNDLDTVDPDTDEVLVESPFADAFPGIDILEAVPEQVVTGMTRDGVAGFRWMTIDALVDTDAIGVGTTTDPGVATFTLTDADTGNSVQIGSVDNSAGDGVVGMSGDVAVVFTDIFSSVSSDSSLSFGMFDNLIVSSVVASDPLDCNGDGMVTAEDVVCATAESIADTLAAAGILEGDLDLDGSVAFADFLILADNFGDPAKGGVYTEGDIDLNGAVEFGDFLALSSNFGAVAATTAAVPEPNGLMLIGLGACIIGGLRRRH